MKKLTVFLVAAALFVPSLTFAATLTTGQVSAIMGVLAAFGVSQPVLDQVYSDLTATSTSAVATTTASISPVLTTQTTTTPTFVAATSTVIAPAQGSSCAGSSCLAYGSASAPVASTAPAYTPPPMVRQVCRYVGPLYNNEHQPYEMKFDCQGFNSFADARAMGYTLEYLAGLESTGGVVPMVASSTLDWQQLMAQAPAPATASYYKGFPAN